MKIDIAVVSSTPDPFYLDFWPLIARTWRDVMDIEPVLIYTPNDGAELDDSHGKIIPMPQVHGVPSYLQALWSRYWMTQFWPDKTIILSDIDMLPLSRSYFVDRLESIPDSTYLHLTREHPRLPSCYHVATGSNFKRVLNLGMDFPSSLYCIMRHLGHEGLSALPLPFWGADESYATSRLFSNTDIEMFERGWPSGRIDRNAWNYDPANMSQYIDAHLPRPFSEHEDTILKLETEVRKYHQVAPVADRLEPIRTGQSQTIP